MRIIPAGLLVCVSLLTVASGCVRFSAPAEVHRVGHVAPRTGPDQAVGLREGEAVAMTVEEFNVGDNNKIKDKPVSVIHGDAGPDLDGFGFQATRLLSVNHVEALLGATTAAQLDKLAAAAQAGQVALVSPCGGNGGSLNKLVYSVGLDPRERGRCLAKYAAEDGKVREIATVTSINHPVYAAVAEGFTKEFQHPDRKTAAEYVYRNPNELNDIANRLAAAKTPAVFFAGPVADLLTLRKGLKDVPLFLGGEEDEPTLRLSADQSEGVVFATAFTLDAQRGKSGDFVRKFRSRYQQQTPEADDMLSADAAQVLFDAAKKAGTFEAVSRSEKDPNLRRDGLAKVEDYQCLTGPFWFTPEQTARRPVFVVRMHAGKSQLLKDYAPEKK
ncbi:MAG: ABC transporter substrate-binding protein [Gemmataceae bacterium]